MYMYVTHNSAEIFKFIKSLGSLWKVSAQAWSKEGLVTVESPRQNRESEE
jgi:hypothetical protein